MPKDKEWSAVATLLNEINRLRERVDVLESWLWIWRPRPSFDRTNEVITTNVPPYRIDVRDGNDTIPLADVRITDDWYTRTATYCWTTYRWV